MKNIKNQIKLPFPKNINEGEIGPLDYPENEDIYNNLEEEKDIDPEDISKTKAPNDESGTNNEKDFTDTLTGSDLDVPGSELDDRQEDVGNEDEENNYYSIGGDNHNDLEED